MTDYVYWNHFSRYPEDKNLYDWLNGYFWKDMVKFNGEKGVQGYITPNIRHNVYGNKLKDFKVVKIKGVGKSKQTFSIRATLYWTEEHEKLEDNKKIILRVVLKCKSKIKAKIEVDLKAAKWNPSRAYIYTLEKLKLVPEKLKEIITKPENEYYEEEPCIAHLIE